MDGQIRGRSLKQFLPLQQQLLLLLLIAFAQHSPCIGASNSESQAQEKASFVLKTLTSLLWERGSKEAEQQGRLSQASGANELPVTSKKPFIGRADLHGSRSPEHGSPFLTEDNLQVTEPSVGTVAMEPESTSRSEVPEGLKESHRQAQGEEGWSSGDASSKLPSPWQRRRKLLEKEKEGQGEGTAPVDEHEQRVLRALEQQRQETGKQLVIGISPTYPRAFQALYFNHVAAALRSAGPPFLWLVIEGWKKTEETTQLLERTAGLCLPHGDPDCETVAYIHLSAGRNESSRWNKAVVQRNVGLDYIQQHRLEGTVYFMDDDNTYSPLLFEELRKVQRVAAFPVGFLFSVEYGIRNPWQQHHPTVERPLVRRRENTEHPAGPLEVYGWETFEWSIPKKHGGAPRTFCTDMAGFAFNSKLLWSQLDNIPSFPKHPVRFVPVTGGYLETIFLGKLIPSPVELEPLCNEARQVLVWHTHGEAEKFYRYPGSWKLPQPQDLVLITTEGTTWNYAIGHHRYGIRGRKDTDLRPGYKEAGIPPPPTRDP